MQTPALFSLPLSSNQSGPIRFRILTSMIKDPAAQMGNMALFSISEDTLVGTEVYTLNGTDPEADSVTYGLTFDQGSKEYFRVNPKSGQVTLIEALDREVENDIAVLVSITDGRNKVVEKVQVLVSDANDEKPEFLNLPLIVSIPEDTEARSSIFKVEAVDKDLGAGGSVTYFLQTAPNTKFTIDGHSGILRIKPGESLDYETSKTHFVTVVAKDGGGRYNGKLQVMTSSATITINVLDAQDSPPIFMGTPYFGYVYEVSVPGAEIFTVFAKDGDQGDPNPIHYSIVNGSDGSFSINSSTGCITLTSYPVQLRNELYELKVKASEVGPDDQLFDYAITMVTIRLVDLNNHPPTFYGENGLQNLFELTMNEHPPEGEILRGLKITVNDSDQGANAKFRLRLIGPGRVLRVVPQTVLNEAQVTIIVENSTAMDYEKYSFLAFKLLAVEIDTPEHFSATADIVIHLLDTNDNTPHFSSEFYMARIPENSPGGSTVVSVTAKDPDSGLWGELKYSIYGSGANLFIIHPTSGIIYTQQWASLDAELNSKYNFYVKAEDTEGKYSMAEVFVTVLDINDHPPEFNENLLEKIMIIGAPVKIEAVDGDAEEPNNVIEYSIMKADPANVFDINSSTGEIKLKPFIKSMEIVQNITRKKDCKWSVVVQAQDQGSPSFITTAVVKIDLTEANQLTGPMTNFLLQSRDNPLKALGIVTAVISVMVVVTVMISTVMYMRNTKSNRVLPARRVIRRKRREQHNLTFKPFGHSESPDKLLTVDVESNTSKCNINRNGSSLKSPPPKAPVLLQLPVTKPKLSEHQQAVPTVSGSLTSRSLSSSFSQRTLSSIHPESRRGLNKAGNISSALVTELKKKLEQKIIEANQGYYY
ncbi:cadherin-related family member 1 [Electrophorus electricus]|uniref:cadherin-related family member 1 n=1 Tax=Electrophorus electricus TaxID=8005 RepID=UPI0015D07167|nr:cadherin-related family member 1 [Electrophorus electricus]